MKKMTRLAATACFLGACAVASTPTIADAQPTATSSQRDASTPASSLSCPPDAAYQTSGASSTWLGDPIRRVVGTGPMTLTVSVQSSNTVTGTVGGTAGFSVSGIIAAAKSDINASVAAAVSAGTAYTGTYAVPAGRFGWLQWGSWGYHYNWSYGSYNGACTWLVSKSGTATSPTLTGRGFNHGLS